VNGAAHGHCLKPGIAGEYFLASLITRRSLILILSLTAWEFLGQFKDRFLMISGHLLDCSLGQSY
jgi:hypothetical protein